MDDVKDNMLTEVIGSDKGKLVPTDIGMIVNNFLVEHFEYILDYNFTAKVEEDFDNIAEGNEEWKHMMKDFYKKFHPQIENVTENAERESGERILGKDHESGKTVLVRLGKFGPMAQIGAPDDEEKKFASLRPDQQLHQVTFEEVMDLFKLPRDLGMYDGFEVQINNGRFGPYIKFDSKFISLPKGMDPLDVDMDSAKELIEEKRKADAPIYEYEELPVQKGTGRFGPFIKWNNLFINVNKKYDFENLTDTDIVELIETKKQKEIDKLIHNWTDEGIRLEKARWGRFNLIKGKTKIELPKTTNADKMTLENALAIFEKKKPKRKAAAKKKPAAKKK
jgi:DNA topoisomerase-1